MRGIVLAKTRAYHRSCFPRSPRLVRVPFALKRILLRFHRGKIAYEFAMAVREELPER